jgi:transposase-like protein
MRSVMKRADRNMITDVVDALQARARRRRWTDNIKVQIVAESDAPRAVVSEVARRHEISPQLLSAWRKAARDGLLKLSDGTDPVARRSAGTAVIQDRSSSGGPACRALGGPRPRHELVQTVGWPEIDQLGEDVGQIGLRLDVAELTSLNERSDAGPIFRALIMPGKQRILAIENKRTDASLDDVGVKLDAAVVEELREPVPVVQGVADMLGDRRLARDAGELLLEPGLELQYERLAARLSHRAPLVGAATSDRLFDGIEGGDARKRLAGDRRWTILSDVVESAAQMGPAERERDRLASGVVGNGLVGGIAVALHDAAIAVEQLERVDGAATGCVGVGHRRRVGPAPGPIVARDRPEEAVLDAATAGIQHRCLGLVDRDLARGQDDLAQSQPQRCELGGGIAHPERQHGALDVDALCKHHLCLPIERQMPGIFGDQYIGDHRLGRQPAFDQPLRRRRLNHAIRAGPAGIFGTMRDDHAELRWNDVEPLRGFLADHMHRRAAARAIGIFGRNRHVDVRQMGRKCATIAVAPISALACARRVLLVLGRLVAGNGLLDVLNGQQQLLRIELFRPAAELRTLQLPQEVAQPVVLRQRLIAFGNRSVALGARRRDQRLQRLDTGRNLICDLAHADIQADSRGTVECEVRLDSISRSASRCRGGLRDVAHMQTRPVQAIHQRGKLRGREPHHTIADRWPAERVMLETFPQKHQPGPVPSQNLQAVRSFRTKDKNRSRKRIMAELLAHQRGETVCSFRKSTGFVATMTFTPADAAIMWPPSRPAAHRAAMPGRPQPPREPPRRRSQW